MMETDFIICSYLIMGIDISVIFILMTEKFTDSSSHKFTANSTEMMTLEIMLLKFLFRLVVLRC